MGTMSGIGILLGFILLAIGAWKKVNLLIVTLGVSAVIALFSRMSIAETWTGAYMQGFTSFAGGYLILFCVGSLLGKVIDDSGAGWRLANTIANKAGDRWSLLAFITVTLVLLYGGVSIFVIIFFILPIARSLFKRLHIPWYLFPGIALIGTIPPVGMLPGTLQILNIIPTKYLGTDLMAGADVGLFAVVFYSVLAYFYVKFILKNNKDKFDPEEFKLSQAIELDEETLDSTAPKAILSIIPIVVALVLINVLKINIIYGLLVASLVGIVLFRSSLSNLWDTVNTGIANGILPVIYVSAVVGVAKTVASVPFFEIIKGVLLNLQVNGLLKVMATTSVLSAMTGSSSGSMTMILELFSKDFLALGYSPELLHRLISVASLGFDSLPWNSVIVVFFTLSGVSYAKGYKHVFVTTVLLPLISAGAIILVSPLFY